MKSTSGIHGAAKAPLAQGLCRHRENLGSLPDPRSNSFSRLAACMDWTAFAAASCQFQLDVSGPPCAGSSRHCMPNCEVIVFLRRGGHVAGLGFRVPVPCSRFRFRSRPSKFPDFPGCTGGGGRDPGDASKLLHRPVTAEKEKGRTKQKGPRSELVPVLRKLASTAKALLRSATMV